MTLLKGDIADIRFRNEENGYTILTIDAKGEPIVCVGTFPPVSEGEGVELTGNFTVHKIYGRQFEVSGVATQEPESLDGIIRFLGSRIIKGVGPRTAMHIVAAFKKDTLRVLEFEPHRLAGVKGISESKAAEIGRCYADIKGMREAVMYVQSLGISLNLSLKIYKVYRNDTRAIIKTNPYLLIEDVDRVGFLTADKIALSCGFTRDSAFRVRAGILHTLKDAADKNGNTYLPKHELVAAATKLLELEDTHILEGIERAIFDQKVKVVEMCNSESGIMLTQYYHIEKSVATRLAEMLSAGNTLKLDAASIVEQFEKKEKITLHDSQRQAILNATSSGVSVITGGPGTGKTTIVKCILKVFEAFNKRVMLMAPTGRAAKRLQEQTGATASTIHRALLTNASEGGEFNTNVVIVDEFSMVDIFLINMLLTKLRPDTQLLLVGDKDQLPSVGAGNVLGDIIGSSLFNVSKLDYVYRQENDSQIVLSAHKINNGEMPNLMAKSGVFFFSEANNPVVVADRAVQFVCERLPNFLGCEASKIQVLCPMKMGEAGTIMLNERLAELINPPSPNRPEILFGEQRFRMGDKVMHIANNYELEWRYFNGKFVQNGEGVFNGDAGTIKYIDTKTGEIEVLFEDGREATYTPDIRNQLILSYAITIHKSQGSEFEAVVIPVVSGSYLIMTRNLLYTAVTRAKKLVVLVGERSMLKRVVDNNYIQKRHSHLMPFMQEAVKKSNLLYGVEN